MLSKLSQFIQSLNTPQVAADLISLEVACAVLLCEVMRADGVLSEAEQTKLKEILMQEFDLAEQQTQEIISVAIKFSEDATDFYQFTSTINQHYDVEQRIKIVELLWQIAYIDGELASIEEHIIRKVADLLHLRHREYIQAKHNSMPK